MVIGNSNKHFLEAIQQGNYNKAKKLISNVHYNQFNQLIEQTFKTESIAIYTFICFLLIENETAYLHQLAAVLISQALSHIEGAYSAGLYHARRAIELEPNNISYQEYLLLFNTIPEKLLDDMEAKIIAQEILKQNPTSVTALETIAQITGKE